MNKFKIMFLTLAGVVALSGCAHYGHHGKSGCCKDGGAKTECPMGKDSKPCEGDCKMPAPAPAK